MARPYRRRSVSFVTRAYSRDPLESIETIGGVNSDYTRWQLSQAAAIAAIEAGTDEFFMSGGVRPMKLVVHTHRGEKYLREAPDAPTPSVSLAAPAPLGILPSAAKPSPGTVVALKAPSVKRLGRTTRST